MNPYDKNPGNLKPPTGKAPLHLIPARPLGAVAAGVEDGAIKYAPYNYREQTENVRDVYASALLRHVVAFSDPGESDYAEDSGVHHLAHAAANILILLDRLGIEYPARAPESTRVTITGIDENGDERTETIDPARAIDDLPVAKMPRYGVSMLLCQPTPLPPPPIAVSFEGCDDRSCEACYPPAPCDRPIVDVTRCLECGGHAGAHFDSCSINKV